MDEIPAGSTIKLVLASECSSIDWHPRWVRSGRRGAKRSYSTFKVRGAAVRRYPSSKVRSSGYALLEQP